MTNPELVTAVTIPPAGCPLHAAPAVTIGERNSHCRKLDGFDGAAGQQGWGMTPSELLGGDRR